MEAMAKKKTAALLRPPNPYVRLRAKTVPDARREASRQACRPASVRAEERRGASHGRERVEHA